MEFTRESDILAKFEELKLTSPAVMAAFEAVSRIDLALKLAIIAQADIIDRLTREVVELAGIAPRRVRFGDKIYRYDAPDNLIPIYSGKIVNVSEIDPEHF